MTLTIVLILLGIITYRWGGMSKEEFKKYFPYLPSFLANTKTRDWGTNLCALLIFIINKPLHPAMWWIIPLTFLLQWLTLGAYWKFGKEDMKWFNWVFVATGYSVSAIPLLWCGTTIPSLAIRSILLIITIPLICENTDNVWIEEGYRGLALTGTMMLL